MAGLEDVDAVDLMDLGAADPKPNEALGAGLAEGVVKRPALPLGELFGVIEPGQCCGQMGAGGDDGRGGDDGAGPRAAAGLIDAGHGRWAGEFETPIGHPWNRDRHQGW